MSVAASILVYGLDPVLLDTRRWVLERAGFKVCTSTELMDAEEMILNQPLALSILCHTLSVEVSERILGSARKMRPEMKMLVMIATPDEVPAGGYGEVLNAFAGPRKLISTVSKLLEILPTSLPS